LHLKTDERMKTVSGHTSTSGGLLHHEACRARVSSFASKLVEERRRMVHIASSWRSLEDEAEDGRVDAMGCIGLFYPNFTIFIVLGHNGSFVISFPINRTTRVGGEARCNTLFF
jgi:hypothetical protein